jgi:RNA recognition motif-containing protein
MLVEACSIFITNLCKTVQNEDLRILLQERGLKPTAAKVGMDKRGKPKGIATATFATEKVARDAIVTLDGIDHRGRRLRVRLDRNPTSTQPINAK